MPEKAEQNQDNRVGHEAGIDARETNCDGSLLTVFAM